MERSVKVSKPRVTLKCQNMRFDFVELMAPFHISKVTHCAMVTSLISSCKLNYFYLTKMFNQPTTKASLPFPNVRRSMRRPQFTWFAKFEDRTCGQGKRCFISLPLAVLYGGFPIETHQKLCEAQPPPTTHFHGPFPTISTHCTKFKFFIGKECVWTIRSSGLSALEIIKVFETPGG